MKKSAHGGDIYTYMERHNKQPLDFSANVNPLGLPKSAKDALISHIDDYCAYPDVACRQLVRAISDYEGVPTEFLLAGNGAADIIYKTVYALKPKNALVCAPTFSEYETALTNVDCKVKHYYTKPENQFKVKEDILKEIKNIDIMFLCNPNNPTGMVTEMELVEKIAKECKKSGCVLLIDECFNDFLKEQENYTFKKHISKYSNVIILKAFTKFFAMAGMRLGYCICSNTELLKQISTAGQAWSVSTPAQITGIAVLKEKSYIAQTKADTKTQREYLTAQLKKLGITFFESYANYILIKSKESLYMDLYKKGILIRRCENYYGLDSSYFRIAVKDEASNKKLIDTLKSTLEED